LTQSIRWLKDLRLKDLPEVGGKNASLGEMIGNLSDLGVSVPGGFATTAQAFKDFLQQSGLAAGIYARLSELDTDDVETLARVGRAIREEIVATALTPELNDAVAAAYAEMERENGADVAVAVRSSATAEDLPDASFAGQQETFLNVCGIEQVLLRIKEVFASLFNDRAIAYRVHQGFAHHDVSLSAGVQLMVRSDLAASGVLFTLDTESGFRDVVFVTSSYGLGETVVQGAVNPDEFYVHKPTLNAGRPAIVKRTLGAKAIKMIYADPAAGERGVATVDVALEDRRRFSLSDAEVTELSVQALKIEAHYQRPMDIEWAKDGVSGRLYIVQARPETVKSQIKHQVQERFHLRARGTVIAEGRSIGQKIGQGKAQVLRSIQDMHRLKPGDVLVTDMTDPDWEPVMKRASAIVTNRGGRTCHAAIIARELGIPAVVGCGDATLKIEDGAEITAACAEGDSGVIYAGLLPIEVLTADFGAMPPAPLKIMMNVGNPERAFDFAQIPNHGVGLARLEFIINNTIGIHPKALLNYDRQESLIRQQIDERTYGYASPVDFYVDRLVEGMATLAAAFAPHPVIIRLSDFKSNEYANLIGGRAYEPHEENPMIGFRGASRYVSEDFKDCFELECRAVRRVRDEMGLLNAWIMIPFVRTVSEATGVIARLKEFGLERGVNGLKVIMMCELPSNALLAEAFLEHFDGFSIGSNDMTQLTLGLDRDSGVIAHLFDERNDAVKILLARAIKACRAANKYIGICGQGPSDHPDFAQWLLKQGIESISLNPDSVLDTWLLLAKG